MALTEQQLRDLISINLQTGSKITAIKHKEVENALVDAIFSLSSTYNNFANTEALPYEVREIDMDSSRLSLYFDIDNINNPTTWGKGKVGTPFEKWAICNGNNTTRDRHGRTSIGYGPPGGYNTLGATGGSEHSVVVEHVHPSTMSHNTGWGGGNQVNPGKRVETIASGTGEEITATIGTSGESGLNKNMQPYIVTLFIQRITQTIV